MWTAFFLENVRFAISLFAGLVFFAVGWLYFDAWLEKKGRKEQIRYLGFFLLTLSFLFAATSVESSLIDIPLPLLVRGTVDFLAVVTRIGGYILIIRSLIIDPIQKHPDVEEYAKAVVFPAFLKPLGQLLLVITYPALSAWVGFLYLKRATLGYERHLKPIALSFFALALSELMSVGVIFRNTTNVTLYHLVAPYGLLWFARYITLGLATFILGKWVFGYLLKRFFTQLFMIFTSSILLIFLLTAVSFTAVLVRNIQDETFRRLETDVRVLSYAIETKKAQTLSDAQLVAQNSSVIGSLGSRKALSSTLETFLLSKDQSFLWATNANGVVLARGEDSEKYGDSLAGDALVKKVLAGELVSSIAKRDGPFAPVITLTAGAPLKGGRAVVAGTIIDNAFVDGIKETTGLEASIYGGNVLSATTLVAADGKSRPVGIKEEDKRPKEKVLEKGEAASISVSILGVPYLASYLPLKNIEEKTIGMLFVGKPQISVLQTAGASIQLTFISTVFLLILSIIPSYLISKYIARQVE